MNSTAEAEAAQAAQKKIADDKYILKRILEAIDEKVTEDSVFDPLWIPRRTDTEASKQKYVNIVDVIGNNIKWVCASCYKALTGQGKILDHFTVNFI
jgi:hypothetical protein